MLLIGNILGPAVDADVLTYEIIRGTHAIHEQPKTRL